MNKGYFKYKIKKNNAILNQGEKAMNKLLKLIIFIKIIVPAKLG